MLHEQNPRIPHDLYHYQHTSALCLVTSCPKLLNNNWSRLKICFQTALNYGKVHITPAPKQRVRAEGSHPTLAEIFFQTGIYWGMPNMVGRILESDMLAPQPLFDTTELTHIFVGYEYPTYKLIYGLINIAGL